MLTGEEGPGQRQPRADGIAVAGLWACLQCAAVERDPFTHADQAATAALITPRRLRNGLALVEYLELEGGLGVADHEADGSGLAVTECVGQRFLDDSVGGEVDAWRERSGRTVDFQLDGHAGVSNAVDECFDLIEARSGCERRVGCVVAALTVNCAVASVIGWPVMRETSVAV